VAIGNEALLPRTRFRRAASWVWTWSDWDWNAATRGEACLSRDASRELRPGRAGVRLEELSQQFLDCRSSRGLVLETSGRHWVGRRVISRAAISNLATIEDDWDVASKESKSMPFSGWWKGASSAKLNFRAAFEDPFTQVHRRRSHRASCAFLEGRMPCSFRSCSGT